MRGVLEHGLRRALLDDLAGVHDVDPVADLDEDGEVVRDEQHGESELALELLQQRQHLGLHHHVERGRGLVGDHEVRAAGKCHRDHHSLLLTPGELMRIIPGPASGKADLLEEVAHADGRLLLSRLVVDHDRLSDLLADAPHRIERVHRALEHDGGCAPAHGAQCSRAHSEDVLPVEEDLSLHPGPGRQQTKDRLRDGRLPTSGLAGEAHLRRVGDP